LQAQVEDAAVRHELPAVLEALEARHDATGLWFQGRVRYLISADERAAGRTQAALEMLDAAIGCFDRARAGNPAYRDTSEQWLAMCLGRKGNIAFLAGDLPHAEEWLLEATRLRPDRITADLGAGETVKLGLLRVGDRYMRDFAKTEAFFRAAIALAAPDVDLLNNAGVYARDRGVQLLKAGRGEEAAQMFERSYAAYQGALELDPSSVRLRNDCALIAIHHLKRDWDSSRVLLEQAMADGEHVLSNRPPQDERDLRDLDEAVGDCCENLALWHLEHGQDAEAAASAARESLSHFPFAKRAGARRHLEAAQQRLTSQGSGSGR
jgi:tetratricopeptide (TPR) repeat protein